MIQRIQSVYLLLGVFALVVFAAAGRPAPAALGPYPWISWALLLLAVLAAGLCAVALARYRNRQQQQRLVTLTQWVVVVLVAVLAAAMFLVPGLNETLRVPAAAVGYGCALLAYLFVRLAAGAIRRDIALVRSMDRLR